MQYRSVFRDGLFDQQVIIVSGGGTGIGRCIAYELASLGATVALCSRKLEKLEPTRDEILAAGGKALAIACDIRHLEQVEALMRAVLEHCGRIDGLVNNGGGQLSARLSPSLPMAGMPWWKPISPARSR